MATPVIVAGSQSFFDTEFQDWAIHKCDAAGNVYPHGHRYPNHGAFLLGITGIAIDATGAVACCAWNNAWSGSTGYDNQPASIPQAYGDNYEYPQWTVRKYNPDGVKIWQANRGAACHDLAMDSSGTVYVVGDAVNSSGVVLEDLLNNAGRTGYFTTAAYSASGTLLWIADHGHCRSKVGSVPMFRIRVAEGYVYTLANASIFGTPQHLTKYDASDGSVVWSVDIDPSNWSINVYDFAVDSSGNLYIAGRFGADYALAKYDSDGAWVAYAANPASGNYGKAVIVDGAGNIILATATYGSNSALFKYDASLTLLASQSATPGSPGAVRMAVDTDDAIYAVFSSGTIGKFDNDSAFGDELWVTRVTLRDDDASLLNGYCIALSEVETPPLKTPLSLGTPLWIGDYYAQSPGLPLALALSIPAWMRDYVGPPQPEIYRLFLTGEPDIELALSSLSIRANVDGVYLSVVSPGATLETIDAVAARSTGRLQVYRGVRLPSGIEQLELLIDTALTTTSYDLGANSGSLSLAGREASVVSYAKTRAVRGISYRAESAGVRRVRAAIDTQLRVGDTVLLGDGDQFVVASVTITVSPTQSAMEISE